ncbi:MAG TPA: N,N-dimethylformamidase beta subunit family domain-containing protein, partial [Ktedonobacteraceae bacterium]|nr:N,N-dimethylformamidase beta subunit family domain-containing protein [Ktedonobacteraceae bacterium]
MSSIIPRLKGFRKYTRQGRLALSALLIAVVITAAGVIGFHFPVAPKESQVSTSTPSFTLSLAPATETPIAAENKQPGTTNWLIPDAQAASIQIQAYASATSVSAGQTLTFYVSTEQAGMTYSVEVYRLGWYGGAGGRLMTTMHAVGQAQGYYDWPHLKLVDCQSCFFDPTTRLIEARWQPSFSLTIPSTWVTGLYEAKLTTADGMQTPVSFEVRGNPHSTYVAVIPDNTTAAYNDWGGYSLYHGPDGSLQTRAFKVSFDRPALGWRFGYGQGLSYEIDAIRWMERQGYDLSHISSVDLHEHPEQLLNHRAYLSLGHDEYWSKEMRDGVEQARDAGVGLAFFGANASFWQIRYAPDSQGTPDRTIIC